MKSIYYYTAVLLLALTLPVLAWAQKAPAGQGGTEVPVRSERANQLKADLGLSPQQAVALQGLLEENRRRIDSVKQMPGYTPLQKQKLLISAMQDGDLRLGSVLSKAQLDKFQQIRMQRAARFHPQATAGPAKDQTQPRQPLRGGTLKSVKTIKP